MGYFLGRAKFSHTGKAGNIAKALFIPWFLHATYDTFALSGTNAALLVIPMVVFYFIIGIRYLKKGRAVSAKRWVDSPLPVQPEQNRKPLSNKAVGCRRAAGITLLVISGGFWVLILLGLLLGNDMGRADLASVLGGAVMITVLPVTAGVLLTAIRKKVKTVTGLK